MKKKLYYTVEKEIAEDAETLNGNKTISVYEMLNNAPKLFFEVEGTLEDNTRELIQNHLDDNGFGDDEYEFICL